MAPGTLPAMKPATAEAGEPPGLVEERGRMALRKKWTGIWEFLLFPSAPLVALRLRVAASDEFPEGHLLQSCWPSVFLELSSKSVRL